MLQSSAPYSLEKSCPLEKKEQQPQIALLSNSHKNPFTTPRNSFPTIITSPKNNPMTIQSQRHRHCQTKTPTPASVTNDKNTLTSQPSQSAIHHPPENNKAPPKKKHPRTIHKTPDKTRHRSYHLSQVKRGGGRTSPFLGQ